MFLFGIPLKLVAPIRIQELSFSTLHGCTWSLHTIGHISLNKGWLAYLQVKKQPSLNDWSSECGWNYCQLIPHLDTFPESGNCYQIWTSAFSIVWWSWNGAAMISSEQVMSWTSIMIWSMKVWMILGFFYQGETHCFNLLFIPWSTPAKAIAHAWPNRFDPLPAVPGSTKCDHSWWWNEGDTPSGTTSFTGV